MDFDVFDVSLGETCYSLMGNYIQELKNYDLCVHGRIWFTLNELTKEGVVEEKLDHLFKQRPICSHPVSYLYSFECEKREAGCLAEVAYASIKSERFFLIKTGDEVRDSPVLYAGRQDHNLFKCLSNHFYGKEEGRASLRILDWVKQEESGNLFKDERIMLTIYVVYHESFDHDPMILSIIERAFLDLKKSRLNIIIPACSL